MICSERFLNECDNVNLKIISNINCITCYIGNGSEASIGLVSSGGSMEWVTGGIVHLMPMAKMAPGQLHKKNLREGLVAAQDQSEDVVTCVRILCTECPQSWHI
ncbi:hypothetical protein KIL84_004356, partial [Mauremys mutica]